MRRHDRGRTYRPDACKERPGAAGGNKIWQVTVSRIAYRSLGLSNGHLLDAVLNLPRANGQC